MTTFDWYRHCGIHGPMTEEHLPPRTAGNAAPTVIYTEQDGARAVLRSFQDGHTIPSLCAACNNGAGNRGLPLAYARWREERWQKPRPSRGRPGRALACSAIIRSSV